MSVRFTNNPEEAIGVTHGGKFHADDILCISLLNKLYGDVTIYRCPTSTLDQGCINPDAIVFDFGYGKFDHHNVTPDTSRTSDDASKAPIPYSSFGLLWKEFGISLCARLSNNNTIISKKIWDYVEKKLVLGVDAADNGIYPHTPAEYMKHNVVTTSFLISLLTPTEMNQESLESSLEKAIEYANLIFDVCLQQAVSYAYNSAGNPVDKFFSAEQIFVQALEKKFSTVGIYRKKISKKHFSKFPRRSKGNVEPIPYSRVGSLWEYEGRRFCKLFDTSDSSFIWNYINTHLIIGVDAISNNIRPISSNKYSEYPIWSLCDFIEELNPTSLKDVAEARKKAIEIATIAFDQLFEKAKYRLNSRKYYDETMNERVYKDEYKNILIFNKHIHWQNWLLRDENNKDIFFVISPSATGGYIIQPVPDNNNGFRVAFPSEWHGLNGKELVHKTNIPDVNFVHYAGGFIAGAQSLNGAIALAQKSINIFKNS